MPTMHIYQAGSKIASKEFYNDFRIVQEIGKDKLFWKADEEQSSTAKGGEIHIWIKRATYAPLILLVRPDWKLSVDGVAMGQRAYAEVDVEGKTIELHYGDYRFVCSFPTIVAQPGSRVAKLRALIGKKDE